MTKRRNIFCLFLSAVTAFGMFTGIFTGCGEEGERPAPQVYTVTFDVGTEAAEAGVRTPAAQKVKSGERATMPTLEYSAESNWQNTHDLVYWYTGNNVEYKFSSSVKSDITLKAYWRMLQGDNVAAEYEKNLTWGEKDHLYIHYLRGAHDAAEHGTVNNADRPGYTTQIESNVYGDWGLWAWEFFPTNSEGRSFFPSKVDESGAVFDVDLTAEYADAGWNAANKTDKGLQIDYSETTTMGIQLFSQNSRINGAGFWVNDGGDIYVNMADAKREKGDYHWFVRQSEAQDGTPKYESGAVFDPYDGLEPGSAVTKYDIVSNKGNNDVYVKQPVAEGWENNSVGYQIFMASFADSDGDGMGDLRGITSKLDYLDELGVDTLWLTPFQLSNGYHGYEIKDYFTVDPRFGTLDDYRELLYEAHKRGMKVLLDFVLNHTATSNPWFIKSQKLVKETVKMPDGSYKVIDYRNFYTWQNEDNVPKTGLAAKQWFKDSNGYYYYSSFNSGMPELNFDYQGTRDAILQVALYWMSFGLDGFRLDAVKHIYMENENPNHSSQIIKDISESGDYSFDVKKNAHFFMEFNAKLKASYPNAILVGENFNGDPIKIAALYEGLDSQFNFNWYYDTTGCLGTVARPELMQGSVAGSTAESLIKQYNNKAMTQYQATQFDFRLYRSDYIDGVFTSNHDVQRARDRLLSYWSPAQSDWINSGVQTEDDVILSGNLAKLYAGMCLTVPGITWIYGGDELGMFGSKTPNGEGDGEGHEDRWLRQPMKWSKLKDGDSANCYYDIGFNNYKMTWDANNAKLDGVKEQKIDPTSIYTVYKNLIEIRRSATAFRSGKVSNRTAQFNSTQGTGDMIMCYQVSDDAHAYRIFVNATASEQRIVSDNRPDDEAEFVYSTTGERISPTGMIGAYTFAIYRIR